MMKGLREGKDLKETSNDTITCMIVEIRIELA